MRTVSGQGFEFDMSMLPIEDGAVEVKSPGMRYKFTAFPSTRIPAEFKGIGTGTITQMKAEVEVDVKRFRQPAGPGTEIRFDAAEINADAAYVEFTGLCSLAKPAAVTTAMYATEDGVSDLKEPATVKHDRRGHVDGSGAAHRRREEKVLAARPD